MTPSLLGPKPCPHCQISGPAILPVRYAVVPAGLSASVPAWAKPDTPFPEGDGYDYLLRALRQGFVYVYYESNRQWEGWSVAEDGSLWKQPTAAYAQPQKKSDCTMPCHNPTNLEMLILSTAALKGNCWIAFTPAKWRTGTLDRYASDANARRNRMQCVEYWQWTTPANEQRVAQASVEVLNEIADYMTPGPACPVLTLPYNPPVRRISRTDSCAPWFYFDEGAVRAQGTLTPWSRRRCEQAERTIDAMQKQGTGVNRYDKPITQLVVALEDASGIAHELAGFSDDMAALHAGWLDELSIEFFTDQSLLGAQNQLEKQGEALAVWIKTQGIRSAPLVEAMTSTYTHDSPESFKAQYQQATARNAQVFGDDIAHEWGKYDAELNHEKRAAFRQCYEQFCGVIATRMEALHSLRIAWLESASFITCSEDFYSTSVEDNLSYRETVDYALASLNLTDTGAQWLDSLINQYSAKSGSNLVWRSLLLNNPDVIAEMTVYLESLAKSHGKTEKADEASFMAAVAPLAGKLTEAYASANELLERPATPSSSFSRMMLYCDRRLSTFGDRFFNVTRAGKFLNGLNGLLTKTLFQVVSGVSYAKAVGLSVAQIQDGVAFRVQIRSAFLEAGDSRHDVLNNYTTSFDEFSNSAEGESALKGARIKLLALIFNCWEYKSLLEESKGDVKSHAQIASAFLGTLSTTTEIIEPAIKHGLQFGAGVTSVKFVGATAGNGAAVINLVLDAGDLISEIESEHRRWTFIGLNFGKTAVDIGFALKSLGGLLEILVKKNLLNGGALKTISSVLAEGEFAEAIGVLASWEVMIGLFLIERLVIYYFGNDLQKWCREGVFGIEPDDKLKSTWQIGPKKPRDKEYDNQQKTYQKALGVVL
ncbi:T6SS effector BTH_I2691 family protein [Pseudescherichia vulneris]|uniref:T6SS effector BTH_I2691 family protein n=1 Tax=Pseudescherichia vulneris TaxID=566 RepID=UPI0028AE0E16|nr:T6SS effector BTH_I2691 family protein [Pseudescherichia vulneris]